MNLEINEYTDEIEWASCAVFALLFVINAIGTIVEIIAFPFAWGLDGLSSILGIELPFGFSDYQVREVLSRIGVTLAYLN